MCGWWSCHAWCEVNERPQHQAAGRVDAQADHGAWVLARPQYPWVGTFSMAVTSRHVIGSPGLLVLKWPCSMRRTGFSSHAPHRHMAHLSAMQRHDAGTRTPPRASVLQPEAIAVLPSSSAGWECSRRAMRTIGHHSALACSGVCMVCGRELTNPASIEDGIGPVCSSKF